MKSKTVLVLVGVVALLAVAAAILVGPGKEEARQTAMGQEVFSDLPFQKIHKIRITSRNSAATIEKKEHGWGVVEKGGYPADFPKISELVEKLRDLKIGRSFSVDPEIKDRLALYSPSETGVDPEKSAIQLVLLDEQERPLADLLIGKARESDSGFGGHYLMRGGQPTVLLVDKAFKFLSAAPEEWLQLQVIDVAADTIQKVAFYQNGKDKPVYEIVRPEKGKDFELAGAAGKQAADRNKISRVAEALSPLSAEDVIDAAEAGKGVSFDRADRFVFATFDGRRYGIELGPSFSREDKTYSYARLTKDAPASAEKAPDEYRGWIYVLSDWQTGDFIRKREELLASKTE